MAVLVIKNMVCPRCITTVEGILDQLNIDYSAVKLAEVTLRDRLTPTQKHELSERLLTHGFELLEDNTSKLVASIKSIIIEQVHHSKEPMRINFSILLAEKLKQEYTSLSRLFSSVEGITIERFITLQKIEKIKELIYYNELTLSEIAFEMNYSSSAHLSTQFKKETGMTPSEFKKLRTKERKPLDKL